MPDRGILVLDVGLSAVKACLFTFDGRVLAEARQPLLTRSPRPGWYVQDPDEWWRLAVDAARRVRVAAPAWTVEGIGVTGHMHAPVLVDGAGSAVIECRVVWDRRPQAECSEQEAAYDIRAHHARTGGRVGPQAVPPKLRWLARHMPDVLRRAHVLFAPKDFLRLRITGEAGTDPTDAAGLLLFDIHRGEWVSDFAETAGISPAILPPLMPSACVAAGAVEEAAAALGLPIGTPVITGAGDDVEALGLGAVHAGDVYEHLGSTGTLGVVTDRLVLDPQAPLETGPHPYDGRWSVGGLADVACPRFAEGRPIMGDHTRHGAGYQTTPFAPGCPA